MTKYVEMIPISDKGSSVVDTMRYVSMVLGISYEELIARLGFRSTADIFAKVTDQPNPYFVLSTYLTRKLNYICARLDAPIRIGRPVKAGTWA